MEEGWSGEWGGRFCKSQNLAFFKQNQSKIRAIFLIIKVIAWKPKHYKIRFWHLKMS